MSPLLVTHSEQSPHEPQLLARPILAVAADSSFEKVLSGETTAICDALPVVCCHFQLPVDQLGGYTAICGYLLAGYCYL